VIVSNANELIAHGCRLGQYRIDLLRQRLEAQIDARRQSCFEVPANWTVEPPFGNRRARRRRDRYTQ
jgi:hypothetical protein